MSCTVTETAYFFKNSTKRPTFLESVVSGETSVKVKDLCQTRWIYRHEELFLAIQAPCVCNDSNYRGRYTYGQMKWDFKTIIEAHGHLKMYTSFQFITFVATMNVMSVIKPVSIKLQKRCIDIIGAYDEVQGLTADLLSLRSNDRLLHQWYAQAESIAASVNV